jgi:hypothetical protein
VTSKRLHKRVGELRNDLQRDLNNIYIWASFARGALDKARADEGFTLQKRFRVPSTVKNKEIERTPEELKQIAERAISKEIFFSVFVYAVAQVEAFVGDLLLELLRFDNRRIKTRIKGIDHTSKIDINDLIDSSSREELIESVIRKELAALFYAAPSLQMEYFQAVSGVRLPPEIVESWIEVKATRDIIVHNSGIANVTYVRKAGGSARAADGEELPMDETYFAAALADMKSLVGKVSSAIQRDLKKSGAEPVSTSVRGDAVLPPT